MDNSTENVTLWVVFLHDVIQEVEKIEVDKTSFKKLYEGYDLSNLYAPVPIQLYNDMCFWVEENLGDEILTAVGNNIGETAYKALVENAIINNQSSPKEIIEGLQIAATSMIQDEKERGWDILQYDNSSITLKRTQTFNSKLQIGLLAGLIKKCASVENVAVRYLKEVQKGDEFDEYLVEWQNI